MDHQCGGCGACGSCDSMELTEPELSFLRELGTFAFLPVARRGDDPAPVYLEDDAYPPETYSLVLQCLEKRGLVELSYDRPLKGADMGRYAGYPVHGSVGLTARGLQVLELLELQDPQ